MRFSVPILLIFFKRPNTLEQVFTEVKKIKPTKLYLACDGKRPHPHKDEASIAACKSLVANIDWPCEVIRWYQAENLGVSRHPYMAIKRFFQHEEMGIVLEDDCLPTSSFFEFCAILLSHFATESRIYQINGAKSYLGTKKIEHSYYFSKRSISNGWASWRRCWQDFDIDLSNKEEDFQRLFKYEFHHVIQRWYYRQKYKAILNGRLTSSWDYQWFFHILRNHGLCITPQYNLVSNIGFHKEASHSSDKNHVFSQVPTRDIDLSNISHPTSFVPRLDLDDYLFFVGTLGGNYTSHILKYFKNKFHKRVNQID